MVSPKYMTDTFARRKDQKRADLATLFESPQKDTHPGAVSASSPSASASSPAAPSSEIPTEPAAPSDAAAAAAPTTPAAAIPNLALTAEYSVAALVPLLAPSPPPSAPLPPHDAAQLRTRLAAPTKFGNTFRDVLLARANALAHLGTVNSPFPLFVHLLSYKYIRTVVFINNALL